MSYLVASASIGLFILLFKYLDVTSVAQDAIGKTRQASQVFRDKSLDDEQKEVRLQRASISLFKSAFLIIALSAVCLLVSAVPIAVAAWTGLATETEIVALLISWPVILATIIIFVIAYKRGWV